MSWRTDFDMGAQALKRGDTPVSIALLAGSIATTMATLAVPGLSSRLAYSPSLVAHGEVWRVVTGAFVHSGPVHLVLNMMTLWVLGRMMERLLGSPRFFALSAVGLLGSSALIALFGFQSGAIGLSGVEYAWVGAAVPLARRLPGVDIGKTLLLGVVMSILPGISLLGHLGGFLVGVPLGAAARGDAAFKTVATVVGTLTALVLAVRLFIG